MMVSSQNTSLNVELFSEIAPEKNTLFFLHGFTGSSNDWNNVAELIDNRFNKIAVDFVGHGKSDSPLNVEKYSPKKINEQLLDVINHFSNSKVILLGYSMGGRAALNFAVNYPEKIKCLILESTSAGIKDPIESEERIISDEELANFIETHTMEKFVDKWMEMEIFNTQKNLPEEVQQKLKIAKLQNQKIGLANSLRGFGTGRMLFLGNKLSALHFPALLLTGELDSKFTQINQQLVKKFPPANHQIIENAGHNTHTENPSNFILVVNQFLKQF